MGVGFSLTVQAEEHELSLLVASGAFRVYSYYFLCDFAFDTTYCCFTRYIRGSGNT